MDRPPLLDVVARAIGEACGAASDAGDVHYMLPLSERELAAAVLSALGAHLRALSPHEFGQAMREIMRP